ncbi:uncharacterized protein LOC108673580 isoform X1 [Hyalella azteca]|uniref:Uncharacterized protein LOC108673580 isoform X1 n=1 Tax=Hyalella azteca TaxID=294128 RepID=A0A979FTX7_HYAAZ|nr:uncharacterized protein LOC108673580 isoform X1 [Hyalella azteca]
MVLLRIRPLRPATKSEHKFSSAEIVLTISKGFSEPMFRGFSEPMSRGFSEPMSRGFSEPMSRGFSEPMSRGCSEPMSRTNVVASKPHSRSENSEVKSASSRTNLTPAIDIRSLMCPTEMMRSCCSCSQVSYGDPQCLSPRAAKKSKCSFYHHSESSEEEDSTKLCSCLSSDEAEDSSSDVTQAGSSYDEDSDDFYESQGAARRLLHMVTKNLGTPQGCFCLLRQPSSFVLRRGGTSGGCVRSDDSWRDYGTDSCDGSTSTKSFESSYTSTVSSLSSTDRSSDDLTDSSSEVSSFRSDKTDLTGSIGNDTSAIPNHRLKWLKPLANPVDIITSFHLKDWEKEQMKLDLNSSYLRDNSGAFGGGMMVDRGPENIFCGVGAKYRNWRQVVERLRTSCCKCGLKDRIDSAGLDVTAEAPMNHRTEDKILVQLTTSGIIRISNNREVRTAQIERQRKSGKRTSTKNSEVQWKCKKERLWERELRDFELPEEIVARNSTSERLYPDKASEEALQLQAALFASLAPLENPNVATSYRRDTSESRSYASSASKSHYGSASSASKSHYGLGLSAPKSRQDLTSSASRSRHDLTSSASRSRHDLTTSASRSRRDLTSSAPRSRHDLTSSAPRSRHDLTSSASRSRHDLTSSASRFRHGSASASAAYSSYYLE